MIYAYKTQDIASCKTLLILPILPPLILWGKGISDARALSRSYYGSLDWFHNIQNGPQTLRGVRETAIVKPIGEYLR